MELLLVIDPNNIGQDEEEFTECVVVLAETLGRIRNSWKIKMRMSTRTRDVVHAEALRAEYEDLSDIEVVEPLKPGDWRGNHSIIIKSSGWRDIPMSFDNSY